MSICDFSYVLSIIFTLRAVTRVKMHDDDSAKFHINRSNHGRSIVISRFFKMAAVRHLGFLKVGNFNLRSSVETQYASPCQIYRRSLKPFRRYGDFRFCKMAAAAILDFWHFKFWTVRTVKRIDRRHLAKFYRNRSNHGRDMAIFGFFKMAAVRHLGFLQV